MPQIAMTTNMKEVTIVSKYREKAINALMTRDDIDYEEASELLEDTLYEIAGCNYHPAASLNIWQCNTGLEPDYLMRILLEDTAWDN